MAPSGMQLLSERRCSAAAMQRATAPGYATRGSRLQAVRVACDATVKADWGNLGVAYKDYKQAPPSMKFESSAGILEEMTSLKAAGSITKWGAATERLARRNVMQGELRQVGIKDPGAIAVPSNRNDLAFLVTVTLSTSLVAVVAGAVLPGDWGFFVSYLVGGITLGVLAVGSTAPGVLQFAIDKFSQVWPDYRDRVVRHEAAHLLVGYLMGVPVADYNLVIGNEHTEFAEAKIQKRLIERNLTDEEIDALSIVCVAGIAAEGQQYDEVMGQSADLFDLQCILLRSKARLNDHEQQNMTRWAVFTAGTLRILLRSKAKLNDREQQNMTRWAVFTAGTLLRTYKKEHAAVIEAMSSGKSVLEIVQAIEAA
ncbi:hypothetical protein FOA52_007951 [Chlamydomonas sp. UWO 241]|nr:hypothetical protein FOA52_007951 [Chlamydomonas sp. UWO 241]